jgi:hypothetical protein
MPRLSNKQLHSLIDEAYAAWRAEQEQLREKFPDVIGALNPGFMWPYQPAEDPIAHQVNTEAVSAERVKKAFRWRMKQIEYPFPKSARKKTVETIYEVVRKQGLLEALLCPKLITHIQLFWFLDDYYEAERHFFTAKQSHHGYPLEFHRDAMKQIARNLLFLDSLALKHNVRGDWFCEYRPTILKALLREAVICYPRIGLKSDKAARAIRPVKSAGDMDLEIFKAIMSVQPKGKHISNNLAYHLAALVCSRLTAIDKHRLAPTPAAVGKNVRDRQ